MKRAILSLLVVLALMSVTVWGQAIDGNVTGVIADASGAVVPGATVTLVNKSTGAKFDAKTDSAGLYRFNNVPIGPYTETVTAAGFQTTTTNFTVELNKTATMNLTMQVGQVATSVEVSGEAATIDTSTAQLASNFVAKQAESVPNAAVGSGILNLSLLSAGVASSGGIGAGSGPSIGGQRPRNNSFNVDGVDNNDKSVTGPLVAVPNDSVASFTVLQNQFSSEFGHSSGGQFNTVVKGGTNEFHGAIYDYLQNRNLNAVDATFARQGITSNPRYDQNRLGANFGGPIRHNKLFFFGSFEYNPIGQSSTPGQPISTPTAAGYSQLASLPGISQNNLNQFKQWVPAAATADSNIFICPPGTSPDSPCFGTGAGALATVPVGVLPISAPNFQNNYFSVISIDYNMTDKSQLRGRWIWNKYSPIDTAATLPAFYLAAPTANNLATIAFYHTFTPSVTNELRLGYNRHNNNLPSGDFKWPGLDSFPNILIEDLGSLNLGPDGNAPQFSIYNTYQVVDNVNWTKGKHSFKFGFDGRKLIAPQSFTQRARGDYDYFNLSTFLFDLTPDELGERSLGNVIYYGDQVALYGYVADTWKIRHNLTMDLGLRYEFTSIPYGERSQKLNALADVPGVLTFHEPKAQTKNFAPRIGLAYSPGSSGNTSIRAGFGMAYDVLYDNIGILSLPPQLSTTVDVDLSSYAPGFLANGGIPPNAQGGGACSTPEDCRAATSTYIPDQKLPRTLDWTFGVQRVFHKDYTLEVRYVGTKGIHLNTQDRVNRASNVQPGHSLPTYLHAPDQATLDALPLTLDALKAEPTNLWASAGFLSNVVSFEPRGNSHYHGLQVQLDRRFSGGLLLKAAYTWSHAIDDSTADFFTTLLTPRRPQDFQNMRNEVGASALDRRQRFSFSPIYETPWFKGSSNWFLHKIVGNWTASATYIVESPEYAVVQSSLDSNLNGDSAGDRAVVNPAGQAGVGSGVTPLKNSAGAIVAYLADNPNARYITAGKGVFPNAGRNTLPIRGINNWDISLAKSFLVTERKQFQLRADFINAFNHPQFFPGYLNDIGSIGQAGTRSYLDPADPTFNNPETALSSHSRYIQVSARFSF